MQDIKVWAWEGLKTALRVFILGIIPIAIDSLIQLISIWNTSLGTLEMDATAKLVLTFILVAADKAIHEWKKNIGEKGGWQGIMPF